MNAGTANLEVEDIAAGDESFSALPSAFTLRPRERRTVQFTLEAQEDGAHESEIHIAWNSPREEDYLISVAGRTTQPPVIVLAPEGIEQELFTGEGIEQAIEVSNTGEWPLRFTVGWGDDLQPFVGEPGWLGQYYHNPGGFNPQWGNLVMERVDRLINFNWDRGGPGNGVRNDNFGVRWTGNVRVHEAGNYTLRIDTDDGVRFYVDGVEEVYWLSYEPAEGTVDPDDGIDLTVTLNAVGLGEGEYSAVMHILTNEPEDADVEVSVDLSVAGAAFLQASWDEAHGYPGAVDWNDAYEELFSGGPYTIPVTIRNTGVEDLAVDDIFSEDESFTADPFQFVVEPGEETVVDLILEAEEDGLHESDIVLTWNSPFGEDFVIRVQGETSPPPVMEINPRLVEADLATGQSEEHVLTVGNEGETGLWFRIDWEDDEQRGWAGEPGWLGQYYHNPGGHNPQWGELVMERIDELIRFDWEGGGPGNGVRNDNFGVRWTGTIRIREDGNYSFRTRTDDGVRFYIDGNRLIDSWNRGGTFTVQRDLEAGTHEIVMEFYENLGAARAHLYWMPPGVNDYEYLQGFVGRPWLSVEPDQGEVDPGGESPVSVQLDATGLEEDVYEIALVFRSNDPANAEVEILVTMEVLAAPSLLVTWPEEYGYPDVVDWNLAFEELYTDGEYRIPVSMVNNGVEDLIVEDIGSEDEAFEADPPQLELEPDEEAVVEFILQAEEAGLREAGMVFDWNAPDEEPDVVVLRADPSDPPVIEINPNAFEEELFTGDVVDYPIVVSNTGAAPLNFIVDHEILDGEERAARRGRALRRTANTYNLPWQTAIAGQNAAPPHRDDLGDEIARFRLPYRNTSGLAWDGELMWGAAYSDRRLFCFNPENFEIIENFQVRDRTVGMTWDPVDEVFWLGFWDRTTVFLYDREGNNVRNIDLPARCNGGYASDGEFFYWNSDRDRNNRLYKLDRDLNIVASVPNLQQQVGHDRPMEIEWVPKHPDGPLWITSRGFQSQFNVDWDNGEIELVREFRVDNRHAHEGLAHDGENLWTGGHWDRQDGFVYDDGIQELYWLAYAPNFGTVDPDEEMEVAMTLNASGLEEGQYEAELSFLSNDPADQEVVVAVTMVIEEAPGVLPRWDEAYGYPDIVDWNLAHEEFYAGGLYGVTVEINNNGVQDLEVDDIFSENDVFSADPTQFELEPGESTPVEFTFEVEEPGLQEGEMQIVWNSPHEENYVIALRGDAAAPPVIDVNPRAVELDVNTGDFNELDLTVSNEGAAPLRFYIEDEIVAEGERARQQGDRGAMLNRYLRSTANTRNSKFNIQNSTLSESPGRDDAGDVIARFDMPWRGIMGLAWDGELMWGTAYYDRRLFSIDPESHQIVNNYGGTNQMGGMVWDEEEEALWVSHWGYNHYLVYDREGNLIEQRNMPGESAGLASDGEFIYWNSERNRIIYKLTREGEVVGQIGNFPDRLGHQRAIGVEWVDKHKDGHFWVKTVGWLMQLDLDFENNDIDVIREFRIGNAHGHEGIAHDGYNLWTFNHWDQRSVLIYDDGVEELYWLAYQPTEGEVVPGEAMEVHLTLDATGLEDGTHQAELHFVSNDPVNGDLTLPVLLHIGNRPTEWTIHFPQPEPNDFDHRLRVRDLFLDDEEMGANNEIGVFTRDGVLGAAAVYQREGYTIFYAYGDDPETEEVEGFAEGEEFVFRVWEEETDTEYPADPEWRVGDEVFEAGGRSVLNIHARTIVIKDLTVPLSEGWNMISINVVPPEEMWEREEGPDIRLMTEQLRIDGENHHIFLMKDGDGRFYAPAFDFNSIPFWNLAGGYLVKVDEDVEAVWGDDPGSELVDGMRKGEPFSLKLWDSDRAVEFDLETDIVTAGSGLTYETNALTVLETSVLAAIPRRYYLSGNYPNPFNSATRISFGLPRDGHVTITVYDLAGRMVERLVDGELTAGHSLI